MAAIAVSITPGAMEFARIARDCDYHAFVFSMKASNPKVMIGAYRLLVARLNELGSDWNYPVHLGVTEAGDGEDGRIKSAIGIGSLLADGIGDTIRVSLTPEPGGDRTREVIVAQELLQTMGLRSFAPMVIGTDPPEITATGKDCTNSPEPPPPPPVAAAMVQEPPPPPPIIVTQAPLTPAGTVHVPLLVNSWD